MDRRTFVYNAALGTLHLGWGPFDNAQGAPEHRQGDVLRAQEPSALGSLKIAVHAPDATPSPLAMPGLLSRARDRRLSFAGDPGSAH